MIYLQMNKYILFKHYYFEENNISSFTYKIITKTPEDSTSASSEVSSCFFIFSLRRTSKPKPCNIKSQASFEKERLTVLRIYKKSPENIHNIQGFLNVCFYDFYIKKALICNKQYQDFLNVLNII